MDDDVRGRPDLRCEVPHEGGAAAWREFAAEFSAAGETDIPGSGGSMRADFGEWVRRLRASAEGRDLPAGRVPATTYWMMRGERIVGCGNLRHRLTPALEALGGHVGFAVRPSERRRGHAKALLRFLLARAHELGVGDVVLTCDRDNAASAAVIRACGGVLAPTAGSPGDEAVLRFVVPR